MREINEQLRANPFTSGPLKMHGSMSTVAVTLNSGMMPADNWQRAATPDEAAGLLGATLRDNSWSRTRRAASRVPVAAPR